ncbi:phosphoenolpyruvate--protein phosphotransferase [Parasphaerochaeta coccoides]|uniref:Phosphoenolpyruvate-protein phosphotransferase n=1 Tax=Parasphaerochaeta coccoides (strain ATCC BAA-1237 / DSM 17374 / SPN1) TaxID=760011 RepID=F4GIU3_PARC1|nr:phosphoenolpyruvate--protein phosphotransferase [Parasphaerochaeta coccoides]AEC02711.1 phosphoenolpyruvate-protein phosphotransferase [Parasphaerochaeta coccoides DSM 17374]
MHSVDGKGISSGVAMGPGIVWRKTDSLGVSHASSLSVEAELIRFEKGLEDARKEIERTFRMAVDTAGEDHAQVFSIHLMMLEDDDFLSSVSSAIRSGATAEHAVWHTAEALAAEFAALDSEYMRARKDDILDIGRVLVSRLTGKTDMIPESAIPFILITSDLSPSETMSMDRKKIMAIVLEEGSVTSHAAILARSLGIPCIISARGACSAVLESERVIVDGEAGTMIVNPDEEMTGRYEKRIHAQKSEDQELRSIGKRKAVTKDGRHVPVFANIGSPEEVDEALSYGAEGVGLFRTEFLFMKRSAPPSEDEQVEAYRKVLEGMGDKKVVIRTLDFGADKQVSYLPTKKEENPALGLRAIRLCLTHKEMFITQLRALGRASVFGNLRIMIPMVSRLDEIIQTKELFEYVRMDLRKEGIAVRDSIPFGIMVETPAAAVLSAELAEHVDFFSIGTNDLTQYVLAADRMNEDVASWYDVENPAVMSLIRQTVANAKARSITVSICGEAAGNPVLAEKFLRMGVDELSMSSALIPQAKRAICGLNLKGNA